MDRNQRELCIKECPFCGSEAHVTRAAFDKTRFVVQCTRCNVRTDFYENSVVAARVWNCRSKKGAE
jgi:Lar family restriction alleviation protein